MSELTVESAIMSLKEPCRSKLLAYHTFADMQKPVDSIGMVIHNMCARNRNPKEGIEYWESVYTAIDREDTRDVLADLAGFTHLEVLRFKGGTVSTLPQDGDKILVCIRGIDPQDPDGVSHGFSLAYVKERMAYYRLTNRPVEPTINTFWVSLP